MDNANPMPNNNRSNDNIMLYIAKNTPEDAVEHRIVTTCNDLADRMTAYAKLKSTLHTLPNMEKYHAKFNVLHHSATLEVYIPWNTKNRLSLIADLNECGWEEIHDSPRTPESLSWETRFKHKDASNYDDPTIEVEMKADYKTKEHKDLNQCRIVKIGEKVHKYTNTVYDVVCPDED